MIESHQVSFPKELVCPAVATDIAAFQLANETTDSYRKEAEKRLQLLLIQRSIPPYTGMWALPGGFLRPDETIQACAYREIEEETGIVPTAMIPIEVLSQLDRDPRGRSISHTFATVISDITPAPQGGNDAAQARWFDIILNPTTNNMYSLILRQGGITLNASLRLREIHFGRRSFDVVDSGGLAFDHAAIIAAALSALRELVRYPEALLDLVPEPFTLTSLQKVQETITGIATGAANFRRKIANYVQETENYTTGAGHRPAKLFIRKEKKEDYP